MNLITNPYYIQSIHEGWQAKLKLHQTENGLLLEKMYGKNLKWTHRDANNILIAISCYTGWLQKNGVSIVKTKFSICSFDKTDWFVLTYQPFIGLNCEQIIYSLLRSNSYSEAVVLYRKLLKLACNLSWKPFPPYYRCEIKPRDFCMDNTMNVFFVDTFPPVLARINGKIICANKHLKKACIIKRDAMEILDVTGSAEGVIRNLYEHTVAIFPEKHSLFRDETINVTFSINHKLGEAIQKRLMCNESIQKISLLHKYFLKRIPYGD